MKQSLPFRATTASGRRFDFDFPLHALSASPAHIGEILSETLATVDRIVRDEAPVSDGDVLQALAMLIAVRARMLEPPGGEVDKLVSALVAQMLAAPAEAPAH